MKTVRIRVRGGAATSTVFCRKHALKALQASHPELQTAGALIFTDTNVFSLYKGTIGRTLGGLPVFAMPAGEEHKTEKTLFSLLTAMKEAGLRRNSTLIALGGGVVGDIGGLAASLYMRGIRCIQVPTTLLSQVDSAVGGKTAIDFEGVKNLIGAFYPPQEVYVDPVFLHTLPHTALKCGLGEIVKHGALYAPVFARLNAQPDLFDLDFLARIVPENIAFKASVVKQDPFEQGLRRCLNLGHTTAHAIELTSGLSHGECVLWGLIFESKLAARHCSVDEAFLRELTLLAQRALEAEALPPLTALSARFDKKNTAEGRVTLTVPVAAQKYELLELPFAQYEEELKKIGEELC